MSRHVALLGAIVVVVVAGLVIASRVYQQRESQERAEQVERARAVASVFERPHSRSLGPADAPVTVVEFLDPECESCRAMHPFVKRILAEFPEDVRLVLRYMPLHGNSVLAAGALEAAGAQGRYWEMLDTLFAHQPEWGDHHHPRPELIPDYAAALGLEMAAFDAFLARGDYRELVEIDRRDGEALGVRGTPTFFVNEQPLLRLGYGPLRAMIEHALAVSN